MNNIRLEKAKFQEVVTTYQNKVLTAAEEVENGLVMYLKAQEELKYLDESVVEAKKALDKGIEQYKAGKFDQNRESVLQQNLVQQENLQAQAYGDVALGLIQVYRALGGGWQIRCTDCQPSGAFAPTCGAAASAKGIRAHFGQPLAAPSGP